MKCPRCEGNMGEVRVKSIALDRCGECRGTWHDAGELRLLKDKESRGDYRWIDFDLWKDRESFYAGVQEELACPKDGQTMTTVRYGDSDVKADICPECRGVWLDRGDYESIVEYLEEKVSTQTVGDYVQDVMEEFVEVFTGPEGIRSELADLGRVLYLLQLRFAVQHKNITAVVGAAGRGIPGG